MKFLNKPIQLIILIGYYLKLLVQANIKVAIAVIKVPMRMKPAIIGIELDTKSDIGIFMLANLVTMTPGTLSLDLSGDKKKLYVHVMFAADIEEARSEIKLLEKKIIKITGK